MRKILICFWKIINAKWKAFSILGFPVFLSSWFPLSIPIVVLVFSWKLAALFYVSVFISVLTHELGHALIAKQKKVDVDSIVLSPIHGRCNLKIPEHEVVPALVYFGGIFAHLALLLFWVGLVNFFPNDLKVDLGYHFSIFNSLMIELNVIMAVFNSLPIKGLDGEYIWGDITQQIKRRMSRPVNKHKNVKIETRNNVVGLPRDR